MASSDPALPLTPVPCSIHYIILHPPESHALAHHLVLIVLRHLVNVTPHPRIHILVSICSPPSILISLSTEDLSHTIVFCERCTKL